MPMGKEAGSLLYNMAIVGGELAPLRQIGIYRTKKEAELVSGFVF